MKRLYLVLILGLCLLLSASVAQAQPAWQAAAQKALGQAQTELGQPAKTSDLLTLTNAAYCQVDGQSCEGFISMVQQSLGCGLGTRNLLLVHSSLTDTFWFAVYRRDNGKMVFSKWTGQGFGQQTIDARPEAVLSPEGWQKAAGGLIGPHVFSVVSLSLTWAVDPPWHLLMAAAFHDHFCPGVNSGYIAGQYVMDKLPLGPGDKYVFVTAPAKCAADALQVMFNTTTGKSGGYAMAIGGKQLGAYASGGVSPMTVAMRVNQKNDRCDGLVLGMDWSKGYEAIGFQKGALSPPGGRKNPMFWISRAQMSREMAKLPRERLVNLIVPLKSFHGPAALADKIGGGNPYKEAFAGQ